MLGLFKQYNRRTTEKKIDKAITAQLDRLADIIKKGERNEEETRRWVIDVLRDGLGYKNSEIETESKMLGKRADIALKKSGQIFMVIECKAASIKLTKAATRQVCAYAISVGADWAVTTNGQRWQLFHVSPTKGVEPDITEIFDISLFDDDGLSTDDIWKFSLLRSECIHNGETKGVYHEINCFSTPRLRDEMLHPEVCKFIATRMKASYKKNMGVDVDITPDEVYELGKDVFDVYIECIDKKAT